jgi:SAM-dependent methyltransferase
VALGLIDPASEPRDPDSRLPLPLTGERTVPEIAEENYWFRRHVVVYEWVAQQWLPRVRAASHAGMRAVLDAGCGEGYGAALLAAAGESAGSSTTVIGLELDAGATEHATQRYDRISVLRSNLDALPIATSQVGLLVSLQVVEHLWDLAGFLTECARVLDDSGVAVMSTPNRLTFSPGLGRGQRPTNPFHVEEFDADQLRNLLQVAGFTSVRCYGLHHGPRITQWERHHGSIVEAQIRAALGPDEIDSRSANALRNFVESVTVSDFEISERDLNEAQDLIVVGESSPA